MSEEDLPSPAPSRSRRDRSRRPSRFLILALLVAVLLIVSAAVRRSIRLSRDVEAGPSTDVDARPVDEALNEVPSRP